MVTKRLEAINGLPPTHKGMEGCLPLGEPPKIALLKKSDRYGLIGTTICIIIDKNRRKFHFLVIK